MRRVELSGSDGGDPKRAVVISYIPLLTGEPGRVLSVGNEEFKRLMAEADSCPSGLADACLWMADNGGVFAVLVLSEAHAIADHLLAWSENRPCDWFMLCFAQRQGRYVAALFPNLPGSVERFEAAYFAAHGGPSRAANYELLSQFLAFVSNPRHTFRRVKKLIGNLSRVGFMETSDFDPAKPSSLDLERIRRVGPVKVCRNSRPFGMNIDPIIRELVGS